MDSAAPLVVRDLLRQLQDVARLRRTEWRAATVEERRRERQSRPWAATEPADRTLALERAQTALRFLRSRRMASVGTSLRRAGALGLFILDGERSVFDGAQVDWYLLWTGQRRPLQLSRGGRCWEARSARELVRVLPRDLLELLATEVSSGAVWRRVESALRQTIGFLSTPPRAAALDGIDDDAPF